MSTTKKSGENSQITPKAWPFRHNVQKMTSLGSPHLLDLTISVEKHVEYSVEIGKFILNTLSTSKSK